MNTQTRKPSPAPTRPTRPRSLVLVAVDGSPAAETAVRIAQSLAHKLEMPLHLLHVAAGPVAATTAQQQLHDHFGLDPMDAPVAEIDVRVGDPATEILRAIGAPETFLTVLTTHGRDIEPGRHLGHVAEQVIAHTMRPILLIRPEAAATAASAIEARRFLFPLDGKAATARALGHITDIVHRLGGSLDVLFVADHVQLTTGAPGSAEEQGTEEPGDLGIPRYVDQLQHEWPAWMHEVLDHLSACSARYPLGVPARVHVAGVSRTGDGSIASVVLRFVADHHDDVIVLVRRSRLETGRAEILRALLDQTPCPVLLTGAPPPAGSHVNKATAAGSNKATAAV